MDRRSWFGAAAGAVLGLFGVRPGSDATGNLRAALPACPGLREKLAGISARLREGHSDYWLDKPVVVDGLVYRFAHYGPRD